MDCTIEILTADKWQVLKDLWLFALKEDPIPFGTDYEDDVALSDDEWKKKFEAGPKYCARMGEEYVGLIGVILEKKVKVRHSADVVGLYVLPEWQGKGIGRKLIERVVADMHAKPGIVRLRLGVDVERTKAIKLYTSLGFVQTGISPKAIKVGTTYQDHAMMSLVFDNKL